MALDLLGPVAVAFVDRRVPVLRPGHLGQARVSRGFGWTSAVHRKVAVRAGVPVVAVTDNSTTLVFAISVDACVGRVAATNLDCTEACFAKRPTLVAVADRVSNRVDAVPVVAVNAVAIVDRIGTRGSLVVDRAAVAGSGDACPTVVTTRSAYARESARIDDPSTVSCASLKKKDCTKEVKNNRKSHG